MGRRSAVDVLPKAVRAWLDKTLVEGNFTGYRVLEEELREHGYQISKSALHRYGAKIERRFAAIKASTEAARILTEGAADDQDARSEAVIALVQTELFESIVNLQEATDEDMEPAERIALLSSAAKNIATLARASVNQKRHRQDVTDRVQAAADAVAKIVTDGGMTAEMADKINTVVLGIVK